MPIRARKAYIDNNLQAAQRTTPDMPIIVGELPDELADWNEAVASDEEYQAIRKAVKDKERKMLPKYKLKVSITECTLSLQDDLLFRGRR